MDKHNRILAEKLIERARSEALKEGGTIGSDGIPLIKTVCPQCLSSLPTRYVELSALKQCAHCGKFVKPLAQVGTKMYMPPYGMTYGSFCQCLTHEAYWNEVGPLMRKWYDYKFEVINRLIKISDQNGDFVDSFALHLEIQADENRQYEIYQAYMKIAR